MRSEFPPRNGAHLTVTTPAFADGGDMPFENTQYRGNNFPGLAWTAGPAGHQILCHHHAGHGRERERHADPALDDV